jgi:Acyclic terpene utilisation family protein AtuA
MPKLVYRVVSACGALGYGYPRESLEAALKGRIDAIICDGGSMDAGPYYLGTGTEYFERAAVKTDFYHMVKAGKKIGCPVILGSSGMAGGNRNLDWMVDLAKEVFAELDIRDAKVAVIGAELDPDIVIREFRRGALRPTGLGPELNEEALRESTIVGQMGIHPLMTALESGAQYVIAGRSCDVTLFASDMIRRGIDAGLAIMSAMCWSAARSPAIRARRPIAWSLKSMMTVPRFSSHRIRRAAARLIRSPHIRFTRKATRSCNIIPKAFLSWRKRSFSRRTTAPQEFETAVSYAPAGRGHGASSSRDLAGSAGAWARTRC